MHGEEVDYGLLPVHAERCLEGEELVRPMERRGVIPSSKQARARVGDVQQGNECQLSKSWQGLLLGLLATGRLACHASPFASLADIFADQCAHSSPLTGVDYSEDIEELLDVTSGGMNVVTFGHVPVVHGP
jgi:hypothetical protein